MKAFRLEIVKAWRELWDPYRPELHYMRGPGPRTLDREQRRQPMKARPSESAERSSGKPVPA